MESNWLNEFHIGQKLIREAISDLNYRARCLRSVGQEQLADILADIADGILAGHAKNESAISQHLTEEFTSARHAFEEVLASVMEQSNDNS